MLFLHLKSQQQLGETRLYFYAATKAAFTLFLVLPCLFPPSFLRAAITLFPNERKIRLRLPKGLNLFHIVHILHNAALFAELERNNVT